MLRQSTAVTFELRLQRRRPIFIATSSLPREARGYARDTITLGWEDRLKTRGRRRSDGGVEFGTVAAARHGPARAATVSSLEPERVVVSVVERPEAGVRDRAARRRRSGACSRTTSATAISR